MHNIPVDRIMTTQPATVGPDDSVSMARQLLEADEVHHLPVVDNGKVVGIFSSADLLKLYLLEGRGSDLPDADARVSEFMEPHPVVLESSATLRDAATVLSIGGYHAVPVVGPDRALIGIVTTGDLVSHLMEQIPRGDGSIHADVDSDSAAEVSDADVADLLRDAEQAAEVGRDLSNSSRALLLLRDRNRLLQRACQAAELYMRSGHAEHEHSVLMKRLADLQQAKQDVVV